MIHFSSKGSQSSYMDNWDPLTHDYPAKQVKSQTALNQYSSHILHILQCRLPKIRLQNITQRCDNYTLRKNESGKNQMLSHTNKFTRQKVLTLLDYQYSVRVKLRLHDTITLSRLYDTMYHICVILHLSHVFDTEKNIWQRGSLQILATQGVYALNFHSKLILEQKRRAATA